MEEITKVTEPETVNNTVVLTQEGNQLDEGDVLCLKISLDIYEIICILK